MSTTEILDTDTKTATGDQPRQSSVPERVIPVRRISFEESLRELPKLFAGGDLIAGHLIAALSAVFPDGEDFFVRSVRHYRSQIVDPVLAEQVRCFIGQEAIHGREHRVFNERLAELGYPTRRGAAVARKGLSRLKNPEENLAVTAALEHFTATMAEVLMSDSRLRDEVGNEAVLNLLLWHALEESEHKAVAFDVYRAIGGSEKIRVGAMKRIRIVFAVGTTFRVLLALIVDRNTYRRGVLINSIRRNIKSPLLKGSLWSRLKEYDAADFHPNDRDTTALEEQWRERLFEEAGAALGSGTAVLSGAATVSEAATTAISA